MLNFATMKPGTMLMTPEGDLRRFVQYHTLRIVLSKEGPAGFLLCEYRDMNEAADLCLAPEPTSKATEPPIETQIEKPPLGLLPSNIWIHKRISEIMRAIIRYEDAGKAAPPEWYVELRDHMIALGIKP